MTRRNHALMLMKPIQPVYIAVLSLATCLVTCFAGCGGSTVLSITQGQLQTAITKYFPLRSEDHASQTLPLRVVLSNPEITLNEGSDRLIVHISVYVEPMVAATEVALPRELPFGTPPVPKPRMLATPFDGFITASASVTYKPGEAAFYLVEPRIDGVEPQELPAPMDESLKRLASQALTQLFATNAVYKLDDSDSKMKAVKMLLKAVFVQDGQLKVELGQ